MLASCAIRNTSYSAGTMPSSSSRRGSRHERELVNYLDANGFAVMRAPASGAATERELPDVLAGDGEDFYAIEAKSVSADVVYVEEYEGDDLGFFAEKFGAKPRIAARFDEENGDPSYGEDWPGWYIHDPSDLYRTDAGTYRVKKGVALSEGVPLVDFV